jgi:hypothetical protein
MPIAAALRQSLPLIVIIRAPRVVRNARSLAATAGDQANPFGKQALPAAVPPLAIVHSRLPGAIDRSAL